MDLYLVVLRIVHIFCAVGWLGAGFTLIAFIPVTLSSPNVDRLAFERSFYTRSFFSKFMPIVSIGTTLAGLLLYERTSGRFDADWMRSAQGMVLSVGVVAGLAAFGHGIGLGMITSKFIKMLESSDTSQSDLIAQADKINRNARVSVILMMIALLGMASFRYA